MTLPPPADPQLPPPSRADGNRLGSEPKVEVPQQPDRPSSEWSPVGVIALIGVVLVLVAGLSVTINRWDDIGQALRAGGLVVLAVVATLLADRVRSMAHTTALAIAVLGTGACFPAGVAVAAWLGQPWPVCLTVAAVVTVPLSEWQRRRWSVPTVLGVQLRWFDVVQVAAAGVGGFGVAAWSHIPAGLVAVAVAVGCVLLGANVRAVAMSVLAVSAPLLGAFAAADIGSGTLDRAGVIGQRLGWVGPLVGAIGAAVVWFAGRRLHSRLTQALAPIVAFAGAVTGLSVIDAEPAVGLAVPGLLLAAIAAMWHLGKLSQAPLAPPTVTPGSDRITLARDGLEVTAAIAAGIAWLFGLTAAAVAIEPQFLITAGAWAIGLGLCWPIVKGLSGDAVLAGLAASATIAASAFGSIIEQSSLPRWIPALVVAAVCLVAAVLVTRSVTTWFGAVPVLLTAYASVLSLVARQEWAGPAVLVPFVMIGAWLSATVVAFRRSPRVAWLWVVSIGGLVSVATAVAAVRSSSGIAEPFLTGCLIGALVAAAACAAVAEARPYLGIPVAGAGALALLFIRGWELQSIPLAIAFAVTALAALMWMRSAPGALSAVLFGASLSAFVAAVVPALSDSREVVQLVMIIWMGCTAAWIWIRGRSVAALAAASTVAAVLLIGPYLSPAWRLGTVCVVGLTTVAFGLRWKERWVVVAGAVVAAFGGIGWSVAVGAFDWLANLATAVEMTPFDIVSLLVFIAGVVLAEVLLRSTPISSIWPYLPVFGIVTVTTCIAQVARAPIWVIPVTLTVGVAAIVVGVRRKVAGLLFGGVLYLVAVIIVASRFTLVLIPGWLWIGIGGVTLLATALAVERIAGGWRGVRRQAAYLSRTWR